MGKNKSFQGKEAFQRMNFLFQASNFLVTHLNQPHLAAYYGSQMTSICKKSVLRMEPRVKRELCKGCRVPLIPGTSSRVRIKSKTKNLIVTCVQCGTVKRYPLKPGYKLWVETPEACVQTFGSDNGEDSKGTNQQGTKEGPARNQNENKNQPKTEKNKSARQVKAVSTDVSEDQKVQQTKGKIKVTVETDVIGDQKEQHTKSETEVTMETDVIGDQKEQHTKSETEVTIEMDVIEDQKEQQTKGKTEVTMEMDVIGDQKEQHTKSKTEVTMETDVNGDLKIQQTNSKTEVTMETAGEIFNCISNIEESTLPVLEHVTSPHVLAEVEESVIDQPKDKISDEKT